MTDRLSPSDHRASLLKRGIVLFGCCSIIASIVFYGWCPKRSKISDFSYGYYYGFGLTNECSWVGKRYFMIEEALSIPDDGWNRIDCSNYGDTCKFDAKYPDGAPRASGYCALLIDHHEQPCGMGDVRSGIFYDPGGKNSTQLLNGSGIETYWTAHGTKIFEAYWNDGKRVKLTVWHRNGQLQVVERLKNGNRDGEFQYYSQNGKLTNTIVFKDGFEISRCPASTTSDNVGCVGSSTPDNPQDEKTNPATRE
jgi:hypothetical protein